MIVSGERLTTRLRVKAFRAMMGRDISWFDKEENTTGSLSAMLSLDAKNVKAVNHVYVVHTLSLITNVPAHILTVLQGTGIRLGTIVLTAAAIVAALVVCLTGSWELTFFVFMAIPLIITSYRVNWASYSGVQSSHDSFLARASHVVTETIDNIKTVVSLGAENYFVNTIKGDLSLHLK